MSSLVIFIVVFSFKNARSDDCDALSDFIYKENSENNQNRSFNVTAPLVRGENSIKISSYVAAYHFFRPQPKSWGL